MLYSNNGMYAVLYILPNQLFDIKYVLPISFNTMILWEHPDFFSKYMFNKKKLVLHRASMRKYYDDMKGTWNVKYIEYHETHHVVENSVMFDPINRIDDFTSSDTVKLESPNFLLDKLFLSEMYSNKKTKQSMRFTSYFYPRAKKHIKILVDVNSTDHLNRQKMLKESKENLEPPLCDPKDLKYIAEAKVYVNKHFSKNYGTCDNFHFPISKKCANTWLSFFLKSKLEKFGTFQDAIVEDAYMLYHSGLSSSLNIGLINPSDILKKIRPLESNIPVNSYEGFVRQLLWREYQRYCYIFLHESLLNKNKFMLRNKITTEWYSGDTGLYPIDVTIRKAFSSAYLHHIERLMIIGNFMLLSNINKMDGFKWFMEFAIDSYEWVMYQNVYDMVFFSTGGSTTHKAYISSSNYVRKMSNFKPGPWIEIWDEKYRAFKKTTLANK